ncbi:MAG: hypothetical protein ACMUHB_01795 [Thermoplasmatota archaeon]
MGPLRSRLLLNAGILLLLIAHASAGYPADGSDALSDLPAPGGPGISNITFSANLTTGDAFSISVNISDTFGVGQVRLLYNWSSGSPSSLYNISMVKVGNKYQANLSNPWNSTNPFWFAISASNSRGEWSNSILTSRNVKDNDPPVFISDGSDSVAYTGDAFLFRCTMQDNIGIFQVMANLTFDNRTYFGAPMCGAGNTRTVLMIIPTYKRWPIWYRFWFTDLQGNGVWTDNFTRPILDNDPPVFMGDLTNTTPRAGQPFTIRFWAADNWDIQKAWMTYSLSGKGRINVTLGRIDQGNFTHTVDIPSDVQGSINYTGYFMDSSGNLLVTDSLSSIVRDVDPPSITADLSDEGATTGDPLKLAFRIRDNIGVKEVWIRYKVPGQSWYDSPAEALGSGVYSISFRTPPDRVGKVEYMVLATDASGNSASSPVYTMDLVDNDLPRFLFQESDQEAYNGEWFAFNCAFSDNLDQTLVAVEYYIRGEFNAINMAVVERYGAGHLFTAGTEVPINADGNLEYRFRAVDPSGNTISTELYSIPIKDGIPPAITRVEYLGPTEETVDELTTGESFEVLVWTTDNINVDSVRYYYTITDLPYAGDGYMNRGLEFLGERSWNTTVNIPVNHTGDLVFRATAYDRTGNTFEIMSRMVIRDNDAPELFGVTLPDSMGTTISEGDGSRNVLSFITRDNLGRVNVSVVLDPPLIVGGPLLREGDSYRMNLYPTGDGLGFVTVNITVSDGINTLGLERFIQVIDNTPPSISITLEPSYRDDTRIDIEAEVADLSPWSVDGVVIIKGETALEISEVSIMGWRIIAWFFPVSPGTWTLQITVRDQEGNRRVLTGSLLIIDVTPPVFTPRVPRKGSAGEMVELSLKDVSDPSGIKAVRWTITGPDGEKLREEGRNVTFEPWMDGDYRVRVNVTDGAMNSAESEQWITVTGFASDEGSVNWAFIVMLIITLAFGALLLLYLFRERLLPEKEDEK